MMANRRAAAFFACFLGIFAGSTAVKGSSAAAPTQDAAPPPSSQANPPPASGTQATPGNQNDVSADDLPEEDESLKPKIYPFNPLEAERNIKVGTFYMKKGRPNDFRAAVSRFQDATKYNPGSAEAYFRLGEAEEKLKHNEKAKAAFERVLTISPDSKLAKDAKKKLASIG